MNVINLMGLFTHVLLLFSVQQNDYSGVATSKIDDISYKAFSNKDESVSIKADGKLVQVISNKELSSNGAISNLTFLDFDGDGYKDLFIEYFTNVPGISDLLIYDHTNKRFIKVKGFSNYPASIRIHHSQVYYSYHRSGCADSDWDSDLFKIIDYKTIKIGTISGSDCGEDETGIFVYRCRGTSKQLIKKMPIQEIDKYKDTKWGFIADYWKHHYTKF